MARATLGPILSSIAGSIGSTTFRNSRSGLVVSNRPLRPDRASAAQLDHRRILSASAGAWNALDLDIKASWNTLAKQETIPSFFSRGRKWTARQLFTCFYVAAENQLTPLPARWLPTPPLFFQSAIGSFSFAQPWQITGTEDPPEIYPPGWYSYTFLSYARPLTLNPGDPGGYTLDTPWSAWCGHVSLSSMSLPRSWTRLYSVPGALLPFSPTPGEIPGVLEIGAWESIIDSISGPPVGLYNGMPAPIPRSFATWFHVSALSDQRLYYSGYIRTLGAWTSAAPLPPESTAMWRHHPGGPVPSYGSIYSNYPKTEV